ncbi:hypothetical protein [Microscilla marina]|uniref:LemA family protein n=1 Tax=Microscilla marina ATCC 23134 TaxID=313606 RepID=A1ZK71_MICM2|nr:hypothetical protein [Microscilla marina]EAY29097.1 hypothetical protein M23134_02288 [Microscilla marina ATCC 23134]
MIGALGILVAIGGFLFLWAMLSYHTMNKIKHQLDEIKENMEQLSQTNDVASIEQLKIYQKRYSAKKYDYNEMVNEMPSKMVAMVFKLKPVS